MVKGYVHAHEIELRILSRMTTMGYKSKEMQNVLGRSKSWVTRNSKRLGRNQVPDWVATKRRGDYAWGQVPEFAQGT